jgi:hypothetical protein
MNNYEYENEACRTATTCLQSLLYDWSDTNGIIDIRVIILISHLSNSVKQGIHHLTWHMWIRCPICYYIIQHIFNLRNLIKGVYISQLLRYSRVCGFYYDVHHFESVTVATAFFTVFDYPFGFGIVTFFLVLRSLHTHCKLDNRNHVISTTM